MKQADKHSIDVVGSSYHKRNFSQLSSINLSPGEIDSRKILLCSFDEPRYQQLPTTGITLA